jgi:hypothetical protein
MTQWYDAGLSPRTWRALIRQSFVSGALGPHTATQRWSYTVPSNKAATVRLLQCLTRRFGVAAAPGIYQAEITVGGLTVLIARHWGNASGDGEGYIYSGELGLRANDTIASFTTDTSSGGGVVYVLTMVAMEAP